MHLQVILNHVQRHKSFCYEKAWLVETKDGTSVEVAIAPRRNSRPVCSGCGQVRAG